MKNEFSRTIVIVEKGGQIVVVDFDSTVWHNRLGYMSEKGMEVIHSKKSL